MAIRLIIPGRDEALELFRARLRRAAEAPPATDLLDSVEVVHAFKMLIYAHVNCAFSPIYALPRTYLRNFKTALKDLALGQVERLGAWATAKLLMSYSQVPRNIHPPVPKR